MACLSCRERQTLISQSLKALKEGDFRKALQPVKPFSETIVRDAQSGIARAATAARSRLSRK